MSKEYTEDRKAGSPQEVDLSAAQAGGSVDSAGADETGGKSDGNEVVDACFRMGVTALSMVGAGPVGAIVIAASQGKEIMEDVGTVGGATVKGAKYVAD